MKTAAIAQWIALCAASCALALGLEPPTDKVCFELPLVVVSPTTARLPRAPCSQKPLPAPNCMKEPVEAVVEVVDHSDGSPNCLLDARTSAHLSSVHYRGQSSLFFAKHQMGVVLNKPSPFLGFPADKEFVLNGPLIDSTLLRNHLAHWLFRQTARYSPRTRHIALFVRDREDPADFTAEYKGIYLALEKISYGPNRVGLAPLDNRCHGSELSGGWAWQINPLDYGKYSPNTLRDKYELAFGSGERPVLMHPEPSVLTQSMRDYFVDSATGPLPKLYAYLYENMATSPDELEQHVDIGSFVDYFLHSEMSQNTDAYRRSAYFFKDRDQPINAGPVWDFNLAYGKGANQKDWLYKPFALWKRLFCNYKFASLVPKRWRELRASAWSDQTISEFIGNASAPITRQLEHCSNWTSSELYCANVRVGGTFEENVRALQTIVAARSKWMDANIAGFYMKLNATVCVPVGSVSQYNCAANGSDDGCLRDPQAYMDAVEFPKVREPSDLKPCMKFTGDRALNAPEPSTIDPCWLSAGVSVAQSALTTFCSGYGYCEPGPGAICKCVRGHQPPTCATTAANQMPPPGIEPTTFANPSPPPSLDSSSPPPPSRSFAMSEYFTWGFIIAMACAVCGGVVLYYRKIRIASTEQEMGDAVPLASSRKRSASYGT